MIYISRTPAPRGLAAAAAKEIKEYREYVRVQNSKTTKGVTKKAQKIARPSKYSKGFKFKAYGADAVRNELERIFHFKCAYCESDYSAVANVRVEHYRPKGRVDREGMKPASGYYWLAAEWLNLLPACERCNSPKKDFIPALNRRLTVGKANWFPLWDETKRATTPGSERREYPLLLNPCNEDPEKYLTFDENGMIEPRKSLSKRKNAKAESSIHVYGLGRLMLVKARHEYARRVLGQIQRVQENYQDWLSNRRGTDRRRRLVREWDELQTFLTPQAPYVSMSKQIIRSNMSDAIRQDVELLR